MLSVKPSRGMAVLFPSAQYGVTLSLPRAPPHCCCDPRQVLVKLNPLQKVVVSCRAVMSGGQAMPEMWHSGCPVIDCEKHAIQFFREAPP